MPIHAVIFDFGGVLVRTHNYTGRRKWEERLQLPIGGLEKIVFDSETAVQATLGKVEEGAVWNFVGAEFGLSPAQVAALKEDFWSGDQLDMELINFLREIRPSFKTAILSNAWSNARRIFTEKYQLHDAVDLLIISAEVSLAKPDARIYQLAAAQLGVSPAQAVFVDDFSSNIQAAVKAGMIGIQYQSTTQILTELKSVLGLLTY